MLLSFITAYRGKVDGLKVCVYVSQHLINLQRTFGFRGILRKTLIKFIVAIIETTRNHQNRSAHLPKADARSNEQTHPREGAHCSVLGK